MEAILYLYSTKKGEIGRFLESFYQKKIALQNELKWNTLFANPVEMNDMIAAFVENNDQYEMNMWISLDKHVYINVTEHNADQIIRYIYERFPY